MLLILLLASLGLNYYLVRGKVKTWLTLRKQSRVIADMIANPPKPTEALRRAMQRKRLK